jgi:hypothetical protein
MIADDGRAKNTKLAKRISAIIIPFHSDNNIIK